MDNEKTHICTRREYDLDIRVLRRALDLPDDEKITKVSFGGEAGGSGYVSVHTFSEASEARRR